MHTLGAHFVDVVVTWFLAFVLFCSAASPWLYVVPWGIRRTLCWVKDRYGNPPVYITENGFSDSTENIDDHDRIDYLRRYINEVLKGDLPISATGLNL